MKYVDKFFNAKAIFDELLDACAILDEILQKKYTLKKLVKSQQVIYRIFFTEKHGLRRAIIYTKSLVFKIPKLL